MNCTLKSGQAKTKKKKERERNKHILMWSTEFGLRGWSCKGKKLCKPRVNISTTNEDLSWSCELVTLVSSMTYFSLEMLLTPGLCGPITI